MDTNARRLNRLPQSHWDRWYEQQHRYEARLDELVAQGLSVEDAADQASREATNQKEEA